MEKKIDLACPHCHGTMELNEEQTELFCPYCRHKIVMEKGETLEQLIERVKQISYAKTEGSKLAEEEAERRRKKNYIKGWILTIIIFFTIGGLGYMIMNFSKEYIEDPFENISVSFSGTNGTGHADIINNSSSKTSAISYKISKKENLSNGENITISANSETYRLGKNKKSVKVDGLYNYLNSFEQLNDDMKEFLHNKSYEYQKEKIIDSIENSYKDGKLISLEPLKMYLVTNQKDKNILYDVYRVKLKAKSEKIYEKYVVTAYSDVVITNNKGDLLRFKDMSYKGNLVHPVNSIFDKDYSTSIWGFSTLNDAETYIKNYSDTTMKIFEEK